MATLGDFYNYITVQTYTVTDSDYGDNDTFTWSTYISCWAALIPEGTGENLQNNQVYNRNVILWKIRYDSGINENMRIVFDGNYYDITGIEVEGRNKFLRLRTHRWNS